MPRAPLAACLLLALPLLVQGSLVRRDDEIDPASHYDPNTFVFRDAEPEIPNIQTVLEMSAHDYEIPYGTASEIPRKFIGDSCNDIQQRIIKAGWKEARQLSMGIRGRKDYDYSTVNKQWFGEKWDYPGDWFWGDPNYRYRMNNNLARAQKLYTDHAQSSEYIYFLCADSDDETCKRGANAYEDDDNGVFWSNHYITFCPRYFTGDDTPWLGTLLKRYANRPEYQKRIDYFDGNKGSIIFHETMHFEYTVTRPRAMDWAYGATEDWELARDVGTVNASINADSYELHAIANYVQDYYDLDEPPKPIKYTDTAVAASLDKPRKKAPSIALEKAPPNSKYPRPNTLNPDPAVWTEFEKPAVIPERTTAPFCRGVDTTKWIPRDRLNAIIPNFCDEAVAQGVQDKGSAWFKRNYFEDGHDNVQLDINWLPGSSWKPNKAECIDRMTAIMDQCDSSPDSNPTNWKHGGISVKGEVKYAIRPQVERGYKPGMCSFKVHERATWTGQDAAGLQRYWHFSFRTDMKDAEGKSIGGTGDEKVEAGQGGGNPYVFDKYYAPLSMTPQAQNGNYIQFSIGSLSWTSKDANGKASCKSTDWNLNSSPAERDIECSFPC